MKTLELFLKNNSYITDFLDFIPVKSINPIDVPDTIQKILDNICKNKKIIFIFDIEFQNKYRSNTKNMLEMGGIIFLLINNKWIYYSNFHLNVPPVDNINKLNVVQSKYCTVSPPTYKKMYELEKKYLYYRNLEELKDTPDKFIKYYNTLPKKLKNIDIKPENFNKIIKKYKDYSFTLGKKEVGDALQKVWKLYLQDKWIKKRTIYPNKLWINSFVKLLNNSLSIVKGNMDIVAINNLCRTNVKVKLYDIAIYNDKFRTFCKNAELEQTYLCLLEKRLINEDFISYFNKIYTDLKIINDNAHNPLVDSFYTLIIGVVMKFLEKNKMI